LIALAGDRSALEPDLAQHAQSCSTCYAFAQRIQRQVRAMHELTRLAPPEDLDGRVVAAWHGGHRQDRAIAQVRALTRWAVPAELDARMLGAERERNLGDAAAAPGVLDRLVAEELQDPPKAMSGRFARKLQRLRAPGVLRVRVERTAENRSWTARRRLRMLVTASLALLFVFMVSGGIYWLEKPRYNFEVVHERSLDALDPMVKSLLGGLTGGLADASGGAKQ
jgi:hypothetical protein